MHWAGSMNWKYPVHFVLSFDGHAAPNPGPGGCGAVCFSPHADFTRPPPATEVIWREDRPLGHCTSNMAEYYGLIVGLRRLLREMRPSEARATNLGIVGDSELIVRQMQGVYKVRHPVLRVYHAVARSLVNRFANVEFKSIPRECNTAADAVARSARRPDSPVPENRSVIFYPNLCAPSRVRIDGVTTFASNDIGTAAGTDSVLIDARFLASLPSYGESALEILDDPNPLSMFMGKAQQTVVGVLRRPLVIEVYKQPPGDDIVSTRFQVEEAIVIDNMPVPLHVPFPRSLLLKAFPGSYRLFVYGSGLSASQFPPRFADHPYWTSAISFIPYSI